jgi:hypothetical protein
MHKEKSAVTNISQHFAKKDSAKAIAFAELLLFMRYEPHEPAHAPTH